MLKGRLGLDTSRVPHGDRHGLLRLERGELSVTMDACISRAGSTLIRFRISRYL